MTTTIVQPTIGVVSSVPFCEIKQRSTTAAQQAARWDGDTTLKFVRLYRSHECLWNWKALSYNNRIAREEAYKDIQQKMKIKGFGVTEIRNKIRILRSTYSQELKKIKLSKMHGSTGLYIPNLKWFAEMNDFLKLNKTRGVTEMPSAVLRIESNESSNEPPTISIKAIHSIKSEPITNDTTLDNSDDTFTEEGAYNDEMDDSDFLLTEPEQDMFVMPKPKRTKTEEEDSPEHSPPHSLNITSREYEDEFDVYGRHVAAQLKQLSISNAVRAQEKIQSILTTFRLQEIKDD